jgi:hypothetical protein
MSISTGFPEGKSRRTPLSSVIRAKLVDSNVCTALGITIEVAAPVLAVCRALLAGRFDPDQALEVYRGETLALRVRSIGDAARLTVKDDRLGQSVFARWQNRDANDAAAPPIASLTPVAPEGPQ